MFKVLVEDGYGESIKDSNGKTWKTTSPEKAIEEAERMNKENLKVSYLAVSLDGTKATKYL